MGSFANSGGWQDLIDLGKKDQRISGDRRMPVTSNFVDKTLNQSSEVLPSLNTINANYDLEQ